MDRSIRKSIYVNELNYVMQLSKITDDKRSRIIPELFENPQAEKIYLLKEEIRTLAELENRIKKIIDQQDGVSALLNIFSVTDDLVIPSELREVLFSNVKLVFFIGAGISKLLEVPLWADLANNVINHLKENSDLNHTEAIRLQDERYTSRQIISIFHQVIKDRNKIKNFYEKYLVGQGNKNGNPYELLFELEEALAKPVLKISTNIDLEWEKILRRKADKQKQDQSREGQTSSAPVCYDKSQYENFQFDQEITSNILYQIHGSMHNLDTAVMTTSQYVNNYRDEKGLRGFLEKIFKENIVLFIGSGMQEFEIIEHCLRQSPFKHFALVGTRVGEENLFRIKRAYFSEINIKALPYYLDFQGYDRLLFVLRSWADEVKSAKKKQFYEDIKLIDEVL
ncbi:MAG: SIR2 family protein [Candidatus Omnitrophica bacterium]|nr:SIR2 family protein [Candidatus Omnitrophota bacterium]MBU4478631.1 SIR2 family protein [Candidatus Omnitrophota bacterium]